MATTRAVLTPFSAEFPSSNFPGLTTVNARPVLAFDAATQETAYWTLVAPQGLSTAIPVANITFGICTAGTATITHVGIGTAASGSGSLLFSGSLTPNISVASGVTPQLTTASKITED